MKALASIPDSLFTYIDQGEKKFFDIQTLTTLPIETIHIANVAFDNWELFEEKKLEDIILKIKTKYQYYRMILNIETCIIIDENLELKKQLISEADEYLQDLCDYRSAKAFLLKAPFAQIETINNLSKQCLSLGYSAIAKLLDEVRELQPQLQRLVDNWFQIDEKIFHQINGGRKSIWQLAIDNLVIIDTLEASSYSQVVNAWAKLAFLTKSPFERSLFAVLSKAISKRLFPEYRLNEFNFEPHKSTSSNRNEFDNFGISLFEGYQRAIKQVKAIVKAISLGRDIKAKTFLTELVNSQTITERGRVFAVKSLCNIAQQAAEMYRPDFEYECLQWANTLLPEDVRTLIQIAHHYKRVGEFGKAIDTIEHTKKLSNEKIIFSSLADIYVQMNQLDEGLEIYKSIPDGDSDPIIKTAIADVYRRQGKIDSAKTIYNSIIQEGNNVAYAIAGLAEIEKKFGDYSKAEAYYKQLIAEYNDPRSFIIFRTSYANLLIRQSNFHDAYRLLDEAVQKNPFAINIKVLRAAVAGLLGRPNKAINELPKLGQTRAFNEWINQYVRGLLLLMLNRFTDAKQALLENIKSRLLDNDAKEIVLLGSAVCFLNKFEDLKMADSILERMSSTKDIFLEAISDALKYHIATAFCRQSEIKILKGRLSNYSDPELRNIVSAIEQRRWKDAWKAEVRLVLRVAA